MLALSSHIQQVSAEDLLLLFDFNNYSSEEGLLLTGLRNVPRITNKWLICSRLLQQDLRKLLALPFWVFLWPFNLLSGHRQSNCAQL